MRRFRLLIAAGALLVLASLGFARPAAAQEGGDAPKVTNHAAEECIKSIEEANSIDVDCQKAPNQLLPETNEIIWGALGFIVVFGFIYFAGLPAIKKGMNARTERIKADIDAAEASKGEAEQILSQYQAQLADAKAESARIIEEARQAADSMRADLQARAEADMAELRSRNLADIESAKVQAMADLRAEVTSLAIGAAEQVVGRSLDQATSAQLVEDYINQVGANG